MPRVDLKPFLHALVDSVLSQEEQRQIREAEALKSILLCAVSDVACLLNLDLTPDAETIAKRYEAEGRYFILSLMPKFYQHILCCIEARAFTPMTSFKGMRGKRERLPAFLQGLLLHFFDPNGHYIDCSGDDDGVERQALVLKCLKQICTGFGYKYEFPASDERFNAQIREAINGESEIFSVDDMGWAAHVDVTIESSGTPRFLAKEDRGVRTQTYAERLCRRAKQQCESVMRGFDPYGIVPKHGPGAVFDNTIKHPHEKYFFNARPCALDKFYPDGTYFNPSLSIHLSDPQMDLFDERPDEFRFRNGRLTPPDSPTGDVAKAISFGGASRGTMVAKNADKGRQINMELTEEMFIQKGVQSKLYDWLESHPLLQVSNFYLTRDMVKAKRFGKRFAQINFTDQSINQAWALVASSTCEYATLDLKDASRFVSCAHVAYLLPEELREIFFALRSRYVLYEFKVNGDEKEREWVRSKTYAPMGSAVCFPMEALVFWSIATAALQLEGCTSPIFVYGDDLIIPTRHAEKVIRALVLLGLRVNKSKSFIHGHFRESCGVDAFRGIDVSAPCRVKKRFPFIKREFRSGSSEADAATNVVAWVSYHNALQASGYRKSASFIRQLIAKEFPRHSRLIIEKTEITGYESYLCYLVDEVVHQPKTIDDVALSHSDHYFNELRYHGITAGNRLLRPVDRRDSRRWSSVGCPKAMRIVLGTNGADHTAQFANRVMGLSVEPENYYLRGEDQGFTDRHALLRWMTEHCEDSRGFVYKNKCSLKIAEHSL